MIVQGVRRFLIKMKYKFWCLDLHAMAISSRGFVCNLNQKRRIHFNEVLCPRVMNSLEDVDQFFTSIVLINFDILLLDSFTTFVL